MFKKVLVANRGEIACRIMRTLRRMGIRSVAVYSDADENALHRNMADESVYIGPSLAAESYGNLLKMVAAAESIGVDAVHPGFGFLAENANFARALEKKNIVFIGPDSHVISKMGDKIEAKKAAHNAGVPIINGFSDKLFGAAHAASIAESMGFPVMLKAAAGGGGKGMRIVYNQDEMMINYNLATNEALKSFNDGTIFIEKYLEEPRHIEIQVMCDKHGNALCLGERECSIQRRHQKIIEEAPSVAVDDRLRKSMYKACLRLLKQEGYNSAGTMEFLVDKSGNFYFLEMNTRIQVEHTVTEMVTGLDIVELMIKSAAGIPLSFAQKDVVIKGWAIEARVCAENPAKNFLPSGGTIVKYREPSGPDIRVDSGVKEGDSITSFYDSMLLKLCAYGSNRGEAIDNIVAALDNLVIEGVATNLEFLSSIFLNQDFRKGYINTNFIPSHYKDGFHRVTPDYQEVCVFVAIAVFVFLSGMLRRFFPGEGALYENKNRRAELLQYLGSREFVVINAEVSHRVEVLSFQDKLALRFEDGKILLRSSWWFGEDIFRGVLNDNKEIGVYLRHLSDNVYMMRYHGRIFECKVYEASVAELLQFMPARSLSDGALLNVASPINGMLAAVMVAPGDRVEVGDGLCVVTAMKMENVIKSEVAAIVDEVRFKPGDLLNPGDIILTFKSSQ